MVDPNVLKGPRLKVERAYRHIDELIALTQPLSRELHSVQVYPDTPWPEGQHGPYMLMYQPMKPIPETLAIIIGDVVHNLRGALDHLATGIIRTVDPAAQPHFPMRKHRKDLKTGPAAATLCLIEKALPGAEDTLLKQVRPENGPNEHLWAFHGLDNDDKHNLLIPVVTVASVYIPSLSVGGHKMVERVAVGGNAASVLHLVMSNGEPITMEQDFETSVEVTFGAAHGFDGQAVIPTLTQIAQLVSETLSAFEKLITGNP
jgi:hypothetical protein